VPDELWLDSLLLFVVVGRQVRAPGTAPAVKDAAVVLGEHSHALVGAGRVANTLTARIRTLPRCTLQAFCRDGYGRWASRLRSAWRLNPDINLSSPSFLRANVSAVVRLSV